MIELFNSDVMNTIFDTLNTKATDLRDSVKEQLQSIDSESMRNLVAETNFRVSKIFESESSDVMRWEEGRSVTPAKGIRSRDIRSRGSGAGGSSTTEGGYKRYLTEDNVGSSGEETDYQFGDSGDELPGYDEYLPGYAQPSAYIRKEELCNLRTTTTRKLTEADLDEADPLYRDRASVMRQDEIVESDEDIDNTVIKCIMDHFERLKLLLLEAIMD